MELSRPASVHHGHLTLTLDFQAQILEILYLRNGKVELHGAKWMYVDRILDPHRDFELWHDLDPWFSRSTFEKVVTQERDDRLT